MSKDSNCVHLSERVAGNKGDVLILATPGWGMGCNPFSVNFLSGLNRQENIVTDPKADLFKCYWDPLMEQNGPEGIQEVVTTQGFDDNKQDFYLSLAGLVQYGGFIKDPDRSLAIMIFLENKPVEQLNKIFEDEHQSGRLPVFFYERWVRYRSSLEQTESKAGD
ncbi:hypothetical protein Dred_0841 [Desulforamulus reducens MI-1]|uniref:Uncharacterized protein n=1 Tax=Desulforamulus reducens (strain ATCC BAA-1160 / DSM 100696 / MI-1) TaxID=349161 RepID=A4J2S6_DESRM|nr:hypothetical protein [Desulforamulus reducens]ABO49379.1 hypothetical protein Dred_0841 [Desulforamulus reducens MI-1]